MTDPGLDLHEWETRWEQLLEVAAESPADALGELDRLLEEMLQERGLDSHDPVADDGIDPEIKLQYLAAHDYRLRFDEGIDDDPGDIAEAINGFQALFDYLTANRAAP
jgi:hypothetical protein